MREYTATLLTGFVVVPEDQRVGKASDDCGNASGDEWEHHWIELGGEG